MTEGNPIRDTHSIPKDRVDELRQMAEEVGFSVNILEESKNEKGEEQALVEVSGVNSFTYDRLSKKILEVFFGIKPDDK